MRAILRAGYALLLAAGVFTLERPANADVATLRSGMTVEGSAGGISSVSVDPLKGAGETGIKQIVVMDNQLTRTYFPTKQLAKETAGASDPTMSRMPRR